MPFLHHFYIILVEIGRGQNIQDWKRSLSIIDRRSSQAGWGKLQVVHICTFSYIIAVMYTIGKSRIPRNMGFTRGIVGSSIRKDAKVCVGNETAVGTRAVHCLSCSLDRRLRNKPCEPWVPGKWIRMVTMGIITHLRVENHCCQFL